MFNKKEIEDLKRKVKELESELGCSEWKMLVSEVPAGMRSGILGRLQAIEEHLGIETVAERATMRCRKVNK